MTRALVTVRSDGAVKHAAVLACAALLALACASRDGSVDGGPDVGTDAARSHRDAGPPSDAPVVELLDATVDTPACTADFERPPAPVRLVAPASAGRATSRRPTFRWATTLAGTATLQLCADRACASPLTTLTTDASSIVPADDLRAGRIFWRVSIAPSDGTPPVTSAIWHVRIPSRSTPVDTSWATGLDLDADGLDDLVVTTGMDRRSFSSTWGHVFVYVNDPSGFPSAPAAQLWEGAYAAGAAGDLDGDGHGDFFTQSWLPAVLHFGDDAGMDTDRTHALGDAWLPGLASAGDVNADGYADLVASGADASLLLFFGDAGGPGCAPSQSIPTRYSGRIASIGDVNGDGFGDVGAVTENMDGSFDLGVWYGSLSGLGSLQTIPGPVFFAGAGDVNGDGYSDLVASVGVVTSTSLTLQVLFGSAAGLSSTPAQSIEPPGGPGSFGRPLAIVGDLDADGFDDLAVASPIPTASFARPVGGSVYVYPGSAGGLDVTRVVELPVDGLSWSAVIRPASDVTGDGIDDLVIGAPDAAPVGQVLVFPGGRGGVSRSPSVVLSCPDTDSAFGAGLACTPLVRVRSAPGSRSAPSHRSGSSSAHTG